MIKNRIASLKSAIISQKETLLNIKKQYVKMLENLPQNERKLADLMRNYQVNEKIYSYLLEKRAATAIAKASIISDNRVIDPAIVPKKPFKPQKKVILAVSVILGIIIGIVFVLLKEFLSTKIKTKEDVEKLTDVAVIGTVPHFKKKDKVLKTLEEPRSSAAEAFRAIRANLKFIAPKNLKVISVTSTVSGEGKTTVASNLAGAFAIANKKTVLINLDMRRPSLHMIFGLDNKEGISNVLVGEKDINDVIQKTKYPNLDVITSGPVPPNPGELIQSEEMERALGKLKKNYDVIIFDTSPVGMVVDALWVLEHADANIYLFRANYSKKEFVKNLNELKEKGIKGLCSVVNDIPLEYTGYGYGYGYEYGKYVD
jgi:capsular exopolysaccharide synthesis family protein